MCAGSVMQSVSLWPPVQEVGVVGDAGQCWVYFAQCVPPGLPGAHV